MKLSHPHVYAFILLILLSSIKANTELEGPEFHSVPPFNVQFSNDTGVKIDCTAFGNPTPQIQWYLEDGTRVMTIPKTRVVHQNGSLVFLSFGPSSYMHDVHSARYRCKASNAVGQIASGVVHVTAVMNQNYDVQVYDEFVTVGNTALLRCHISAYASNYVMVTSWTQDDVIHFYPNVDSGGKHLVLGNGDLYINNVDASDGFKSYTCRTVHKLTGEIRSSTFPGHITVNEPTGNQRPRVIVESDSRKHVKVGEDLILSCLSQGFPLPSYRWYRENDDQLTTIVHDPRVSIPMAGLLKIEKIRLEDDGKYACVSNNSVGEETVRHSVFVTEPLMVNIRPQKVVGSSLLDPMKSLQFVCTVNGYPINRISWYKNGQPLVQINGRVRVATTANKQVLHLSSLNKDDQGMYQCFGTNDWDTAYDSTQLLLGDIGPELVYWFTEQTLQPGPSLSLKCVASGNPLPQFTWNLDGFPIPESNRVLIGQYVTAHDDVVAHVNISSLKVEDSGEYTCTAHNEIAQASHSSRINVYGIPFIREMPNVRVVAGKQLSIKCPVAGYPIESITWERDGLVLPRNRRQKVYSNGTLTVDQVQRQSDAGSYTCLVKNHHGQFSRRNVEVKILVRPKILPIPPMTNLLAEGMRAAISCQIVEGDLPVMFTWMKNGGEGKSDLGQGTTTRHHDEYSSSLIIEHITANNAGNYTCIATNAAGEEKYTVPLTVNVPPKWTVEPQDTNVIMTYPCMLHCQAEGYPTPTIVWRKSFGDNMGDFKDFLYEPNVNFFRNGTIEFLHTSKANEGKYMCEAKNGIGSGLSKVIRLEINVPAKFRQKSKQIQAKLNSDALIQCSAVGDYPLKITWKGSNNMPILEEVDQRYSIRQLAQENGMASELGISPVYRHDTGVLKCTANNEYGQDEMTIELIVQEAPENPKGVRIVNQHSRSVEVTWDHPYDGNSVLLHYIVQYKQVASLWPTNPVKVIVAGNQNSVNVEDLQPAIPYHFRVIAENAIGPSEPSDEVQVSTLEEAPAMAPQNIRAETKSKTEILIMWEPPRAEACNGILTGYNIGYLPIDDLSSAVTSAAPFTRYIMKTIIINSHYGEEITLNELVPFTKYSVIVQAFNRQGRGPFSDPITAQTDEGVPTMPPENVACRSLTSQSIQVSWDMPPVVGRNGKIQGYKVSYQPAEDWYEKNEYETKITTAQYTTIQALSKYTNYSISVFAFTSKGDGTRSKVIYCKTEEDTPSMPADIKAAISSINSIIVSWLPPLHPNGKLTGYLVYTSVLTGHKDSKPIKRILGPSVEVFETTRIIDGAKYQFWVKSTTKVGEGESTRTITVLPTIKVPAQIVSFSQLVNIRWKKNVTLNCKRVGIPFPQPIWTKDGRSVTSSGRYQINKDGALVIHDVQHTDRGNYTCFVENTHGKDEIVYTVNVRVPPPPPKLSIHVEQTDSLHLKWTDTAEPDVPILGYIINYKREHGDWEEIQIDGKSHSRVLQNLNCGTKYQVYITAFNKIGTGLPCDIMTAYTKGSVPVPPVLSLEAVTYNSSAISAWLDHWNDGGCGILYYAVEWRQPKLSDEWVSNGGEPVTPVEQFITVGDLEPATKYQLKITAHNAIGSAYLVYNVTTLTVDGATVIPFDVYTELTPESSAFTSITTAVSLIIALTFVSSIAAFTYYYKVIKRPDRPVPRDNDERNRDNRYSVRGQSQQTLSCDSATFKTDSTDYIDEICPYATFELAKPPQGESTFSGNIYSGPYHSVRRSFVYHQPKPSTSESFNFSGQRKEHEYTKVRQKGRKLRDPHSESQESDNLGSTDSEVKRILSLHLPISEYDTHGSDSENDEARRNQSASQELVSFRRRMSRDVDHEDSSTSSENSLSDVRKPPVLPTARKPKSKSQGFSKRPSISKNGYPSHSEEIQFSERLNPPARFSDRPMRQNEGNEFERRQKISSHQRKSPRRLVQETSFQIDV